MHYLRTNNTTNDIPKNGHHVPLIVQEFSKGEIKIFLVDKGSNKGCFGDRPPKRGTPLRKS